VSSGIPPLVDDRASRLAVFQKQMVEATDASTIFY